MNATKYNMAGMYMHLCSGEVVGCGWSTNVHVHIQTNIYIVNVFTLPTTTILEHIMVIHTIIHLIHQ